MPDPARPPLLCFLYFTSVHHAAAALPTVAAIAAAH
jgi:hypothetical protein